MAEEPGNDVGTDDAPDVEVDAEAVDADLDAVESRIEPSADDDSPLSGLVVALRERMDDSLRYLVRYSEDGHRVLYVRDDVAEATEEGTLADRVEWLVLKALGDPTDDRTLSTYGSLDAVMRWYDDRIVTVYPTGEWTGVITVADRTASPAVDRTLDHLRDR